MSTRYTLPEMPLLASTWYNLPDLPPQEEPDATTICSLSPVRPEDFFRGTGGTGVATATHIIRCLPDHQVGDNSGQFINRQLFPCTVFEIPPESGHWYCTVWYHEVGAGFLNHHARIYAVRFTPFFNANEPVFQGWI